MKAFPRRTDSPAAEPITLPQALAHLREVSDAGELDAYVTRLIIVAREACEVRTERTLITTPWRLKLDAFPACGAIELLQPPVIAVQSLSYLDADGVSQTINPADYVVDTASEPGWLVPAPDKTWPATQSGAINAVTVDYTAGYGATADAVPEQLKQWMLCAIQHMHDERGWNVPEDFAPGLINPYRLMGV